MRRLAPFLLLVAVALATLLPLACSPSSSPTFAGGGGASSSATGSGGDLFGSGNGSGGGMAQSLTIEPANAVIDVDNGMSAPVSFTAFVNGILVIPSSLSLDSTGIASVDKLGKVTATGNQGGVVKLKAMKDGLVATATITVNLHLSANPDSVPPADQMTLEAASSPDGTTTWEYPYDKTVFPKGLLAPPLMWTGGGDDTYEVHLAGKYAEYKLFTKAPNPSKVAIDEEAWKQLTESGKGGPVKVTVARLVAGQASATLVADHTWTIANGSLRGTVYYWSNNLGRVLRIKPGAASPEDFLQGAGVGGCSTCHSVSANGSTLIIGGDVDVSTWDLLANQPVLSVGSVGKSLRNWAMPAISPKGKFLVENNAPLPGPPGGSDGMWDPTTGMKLGGTGLDGVFLDMPAFGPSGTKLAYVDHNAHTLGVYDFDEATGMVSNAVKLVEMGGDSSLNAIAFPSVSPDAKSVVYHRGVWPNSLDTRNGPGDLYLASVDQPGVEVRLAEINGDAYAFAAGDRDRHQNYEPTFAPLNSGGYAWVVFTSRRTYGNELTGDSASTKQLWVAAIDQSPVPGADPSHPAFRVPGQDENLNMRGFWALDPCKPIGEGCGTGSECCNQNCVEGVCKDPMPNMCSDDGNACTTDSDCCEMGSKCINGICSAPPPN